MIQVRAYQQDAVRRAAAGLRVPRSRGQIHHACGTGKTVTAILAAQELVRPGGLAVWTVPTLELVEQTLRSWTELAEQAATFLVVAGDETVVDPVARLGEMPCPVTTDPAAIVRWLRDGHEEGGPTVKVVLSTAISSHRVGEALLSMPGAQADLLVVDEAHETAGRAGKHTALLHDDRRLPAARRLYLTATPRMLTGRTGTSDDDEVVAMDGPLFGPVLHRYPFSAAVRDGWIDDYRLAVIGVGRLEVLAALRRFDPRAATDGFAPSLHAAAVQVALARAARQWDLRRVIAFCPRIAEAQAFARTLPGTLAVMDEELRPSAPLTSLAVWGEQSPAERAERLAALRQPPGGGWTVVANAQVLARGVDVPAVDSIVFTHPKKSTVQIVQAVGRAVRPHPEGRRPALVLVPILLPDDPEELTDVGDPAEYETLWQVVRALRAHDDALAAELDTSRHGLAATGRPPRMLTKFMVDLPDGFGDTWLDHLTVRMVRSASSAWWDGLAAAEAFHAEQGHLLVPPRHTTASGYPLGAWIVQQRKMRRRRLLGPERVDTLDALGMVWDPVEARWQALLDEAAGFHRRHGHLAVPTTSGPDVVLGRRLSQARARRQDGRLPARRAESLAAIDPLWADPQLSRGLAAARQFHARTGHLRVPQRHHELGCRLDRWLAEQRAARTSGTIDPVVESVLIGLGIDWEAGNAAVGAAILDGIRAFYTEHGHLDVADPEQQAWLKVQGQRARRGELSAERAAALAKMGFREPTESRSERAWNRGLAAAVAFHSRTGHLRVPPGHLEGSFNLSDFLVRQRMARRRGRLTPEQEATLERLGIDWDPRMRSAATHVVYGGGRDVTHSPGHG